VAARRVPGFTDLAVDACHQLGRPAAAGVEHRVGGGSPSTESRSRWDCHCCPSPLRSRQSACTRRRSCRRPQPKLGDGARRSSALARRHDPPRAVAEPQCSRVDLGRPVDLDPNPTIPTARRVVHDDAAGGAVEAGPSTATVRAWNVTSARMPCSGASAADVQCSQRLAPISIGPRPRSPVARRAPTPAVRRGRR
jgi:hypothetical protein